jgi:hypothetical protein
VRPTRPADPDIDLRRLIGGWFHPYAFADGAGSVDDIVDDYLGDDAGRASVRAAAAAGHRLLAARHREEDLAEILKQMGLSLLPQPCGFADHEAFLTHVVARLDRGLSPAR